MQAPRNPPLITIGLIFSHKEILILIHRSLNGIAVEFF